MENVREMLSRMVEVALFQSRQSHVLAYSTSSIYGGGCNRGGDRGDLTGNTGKSPDPENGKPNKQKNGKSKLVEALEKLQEAISEVLRQLQENDNEKK